MKIAVFALNPNFYARIGQELQQHHRVRVYKHTNNETFNLVNVMRLVDWCDLAYFEFAQYPLSVVTNLASMDKPIVVRGHGIPLFEPHQVDWEKVSLLIVSPICRKIFLDQKPKHIPEIKELAIGCDPDFYTFSPRRRQKQFGKTIMLQSTVIRPKKRVYTTIQTFGEIYDQDPEWKLWIVGNWKSKGFKEASLKIQEEYNWPIRELIGILGLEDAILATDYMGKPAYRQFLFDHDVFWSNSILEGFQVALAEGLCTGMFPVINCWFGADEYYKPEWIHRSQSSMVKAILDWGEKSPEEKLALANESREWMRPWHINAVAIAIREAIENVCEK